MESYTITIDDVASARVLNADDRDGRKIPAVSLDLFQTGTRVVQHRITLTNVLVACEQVLNSDPVSEEFELVPGSV